MEEKICYSCFSQLNTDGLCPNCGYDPAVDEGKYPLALKSGSILNGRYIVGRTLGQGGFGITYIAQDVQTGEKVAIKEYFPETMATRTGSHNVTAFSGQRQENFTYGMQCFLSEAQTLAQFIGMEHIVRVHSYFEENGTAYFVMDYIDGVSFQAYLKQKGGKIPWEEAKSILFPIMDALSTVHSRGIIHRDISPDNIYITSDGNVKLLDFGAARYSLGDKSRSLDVVLKAGYAPKEQYTRRGRQGPFTDVYAMAATFYFALTGRVPPEAIDRMDEDDLIPPSSCGVRLPRECEDALEKALAVQAADRFQSMAEFREALTSKEEEIVLSVPTPAPQHTPASMPPTTPTIPEKEKPIQPAQKKSRKIWILPAALLVALAAVFGSLAVKYIFVPGGSFSNMLTYFKATRLMENGNYLEAATHYQELGDYLDAKVLADQNTYDHALQLAESNKYSESISYFKSLGNYRDAEEQPDKTKYAHALTYIDEGRYKEALALLVQLSIYKDSRDLTTSTQYLYAVSLIEEKEYINAVKILSTLKGYRDSNTLLKKYQWIAAEPGSTFLLGYYEQGNDKAYTEDIQWVVLDVQNGKALLISRYILDSMPRGGATWSSSSLRTWLNGTFLKTAFTEQEQARLLSTAISTPDSTAGISGGPDTKDTIFLLSTEEYQKYGKVLQSARETAYAAQQRESKWKDIAENCWWLRSPGVAFDRPAYIYTRNGIMNLRLSENGYGSSIPIGVRPAMWVNLNG